MWNVIDHNRGVFVGILVCVMVLLMGFGCQSTVSSLLDPTKKVTRDEFELEIKQSTDRIVRETERTVAELQAQIDAILAKASVDAETLEANAAFKRDSLDKQDAVKKTLLEVGSTFAQGGTVNPIGIALTLAGILGIGAVADNQRKDGIITDIKQTVAAKLAKTSNAA